MFARLLGNFPGFGDKNVKLYYFLTFFMNGWFILPNWVFYFSKFTTIPLIGLIDGISKLVAVSLEVPTGAVSDLIGKKKTLILGNLFLVGCCLILINARDFYWLLTGSIIMFIGFAFISGAKEAILYDSLLDIKKEIHYDEVLGKVNSIVMFTTVLSVFLGGWFYGLDPRLTFSAWAVFSLIAIVILLFMREPYSDNEHISYSVYFSKIKDGVNSIFNKPIISFVLPVLFLSMLIKSYEGVIRQNTGAYFGFNGETFGYIFALISIPTILVSFNYSRIASKLKGNMDTLIVALYALGFLLVFLTNRLIFGVASFLSIYVAQEISKPFVLSLVNKNTDSKHRATSISTVSLLSEIPYIVIVIFLGTLLELESIRYLYFAFFVALCLYWTSRRIYRKI